jgi:hypothetical protein
MPDEPLYDAIISRIFDNHYRKGSTGFEFDRKELATAAKALGLDNPKNLGDPIYSFRYRKPLPARIRAAAAGGLEWTIEPAGRAKYRFRLSRAIRILPRADLIVIKIPDSTPDIVAAHAQGDEQALLARVRYNRLVDVFLGIAAYSLQNHLRTTVKGMGQIEIDELYVGVSRGGQQFVIPVQAKGGNDQLAPIQTQQDIACCEEKFASLKCRPVSAQFMADGVIAMFELTAQDGQIRVVDEKHYKLAPSEEITAEELRSYGER